MNFLLRDTISLTMMGGSKQTNVIPPEAWANLDVRMLPGADPKALMESIRRVINDPNVTVEPRNPEFRVANFRERIPRCIARFARCRENILGTPVVPHITSGYTENQRYRPLGIHAYGFTPYTATEEEGSPSTATTNACAWRNYAARRRYSTTWSTLVAGQVVLRFNLRRVILCVAPGSASAAAPESRIPTPPRKRPMQDLHPPLCSIIC